MTAARRTKVLISAASLLIAIGAVTGLNVAFASPDSHTTSKSKTPDASDSPKTTKTPSTKSEKSSKMKTSGDQQKNTKAEDSKAAEANHEADTEAETHDSVNKDTEEHAETAKSAAPVQAATPPTAEEALKLLTDGNTRWVESKTTNPNTEASRRSMTAQNGQFPFVTVITCADSRCPAERIFDQGVGDVFVARVAGNVIDVNTAATVEYGVEHLHTPLVVVMGHTSCGAVKAACSGAKVGHNIDQLLAEIQPAVARAHNSNPNAQGDELVSLAVRENVFQSIFDLLKTSPMTASMVQEHKVQIVGAVYDISTGKVSFMGEHPWQDQLIQAVLTKSREATQQTADAEPMTTH